MCNVNVLCGFKRISTCSLGIRNWIRSCDKRKSASHRVSYNLPECQRKENFGSLTKAESTYDKWNVAMVELVFLEKMSHFAVTVTQVIATDTLIRVHFERAICKICVRFIFSMNRHVVFLPNIHEVWKIFVTDIELAGIFQELLGQRPDRRLHFASLLSCPSHSNSTQNTTGESNLVVIV